MRRQSRRGWLLVGLIVLISAVILALAGITFYLTEHLRSVSLRQNQTKAAYLAQAGIMQAIYDFRFNDGAIAGSDNCFTAGEYNATTGAIGNFPNEDVFILGGKAADFLMANMIPGVLNTGNLVGVGIRDRLQGWSVQNVLCALPPGLTAVRIDWITVSWANAVAPPAEGVIRIEIPAGTRVWPQSGTASAPQASGTRLDITNTTIPVNTARSGVIWFTTNGVMTDGSTKLPIDVTFEMSDHNQPTPIPPHWSLRMGRHTPQANLAGRSGSFTVKSVGEVRKGAFPFSVWRRVQAEYRLNDADGVTDRQEIGTITTDPSPAANRPGFKELGWRTP